MNMDEAEFKNLCIANNLDFKTEEKKLISGLKPVERLNYKMDTYHKHPDFYNKWHRARAKMSKFKNTIIIK